MFRMKIALSLVLRHEHPKCEYFGYLLHELQTGSMGTRSAHTDSSSGLDVHSSCQVVEFNDV